MPPLFLCLSFRFLVVVMEIQVSTEKGKGVRSSMNVQMSYTQVPLQNQLGECNFNQNHNHGPYRFVHHVNNNKKAIAEPVDDANDDFCVWDEDDIKRRIQR